MKLRPRTVAGHAAFLLIGLSLGTFVGLGASALLNAATDSPAPLSSPPQRVETQPIDPAPDETAPQDGSRSSRLLLAWASGGLPAGAEAEVERIRAVERATTVTTATDWARELKTPHFPKGSVPLESAVIDPLEYARFVPPSARREVSALAGGEGLVAGSTSTLRAALEDGSLQLENRDVRIRGAIDRIASNGYELLLAGEVPSSWVSPDNFLLIRLRHERARKTVERRLEDMLRPGQSLRVRAKGETPFLRYGDAVLPQLLIKETFGEFAAIPLDNGHIVVDPSWRRANIQTRRLPILGPVTCHRVLIPQLRAALRQVRDEGLSHTINPGQYGGCFGPRFISLEPRGRLSHHAWGAAIDINVAENAFGTKADQDPRLVEIMERHGFTWGGRWLVPDGMHFEWVAFP